MKNQNFFTTNFISLNFFNFYLLLNLSKHTNKNIIFNKKLEKLKIDFTLKNNLLLKYVKYFNKLVFYRNINIKNNQLNYYNTFNKKNSYYLNNYNNFYFKKFINLLFFLNSSGYNFLVLDKSYKNVLPLYNYIFNFKNLLLYKKYFFIDTKFFTYNNWHTYYSAFLQKFNIVFLIIFDFFHFNKFFKILKNINLPISSLLPINNFNSFIDYPIYTSLVNKFEKFVFYSIITQTVLISFNYKSYDFKIKYLKLFYNFSLKFNFNQ